MPVFLFVPEPSWLTATVQAGRVEGEESCELVCVSGAGGGGSGGRSEWWEFRAEGGSGRLEGCLQSPATLLAARGDSAFCQPQWLWGDFISGDGTHLIGIYYPFSGSDHSCSCRRAWLASDRSFHKSPAPLASAQLGSFSVAGV